MKGHKSSMGFAPPQPTAELLRSIAGVPQLAAVDALAPSSATAEAVIDSVVERLHERTDVGEVVAEHVE